MWLACRGRWADVLMCMHVLQTNVNQHREEEKILLGWDGYMHMCVEGLHVVCMWLACRGKGGCIDIHACIGITAYQHESV